MYRVSDPHTNCARSYLELYTHDYKEAKELFLLASAYLDTIS